MNIPNTPSWHSVAMFHKIPDGTVLTATQIDTYIQNYIEKVWRPLENAAQAPEVQHDDQP